MNYYRLALTCLLNNPLLGMKKSDILRNSSYQEGNQHLLLIDSYYLGNIIRAHPDVFPPTAHVLSGHTHTIMSVALTPDW